MPRLSSNSFTEIHKTMPTSLLSPVLLASVERMKAVRHV
jgi:hypothetical protein